MVDWLNPTERQESALGVRVAMSALGGTRMLILTSLREGTGNAVTAARLAERIPAAHCSLLDINALPDAAALREHVCEGHIGLVLGIHVGDLLVLGLVLGFNLFLDFGSKLFEMLAEALQSLGQIRRFLIRLATCNSIWLDSAEVIRRNRIDSVMLATIQ